MNPILTTCSTWLHRDGGRYYRFSRLFGEKRPRIEKIQFAGLGGGGGGARPVLTVARPIDVESVLTLSSMDTTLAGAPIVWLGGVKCYKIGTGLKYYVPKHLLPLLGSQPFNALFCLAKAKSGLGIPVLVLNTKGKVPSHGESSLPSGDHTDGASADNAVEAG
jgi:hypothetical protein